MKNLSIFLLAATLFVACSFVSYADTKQDIEKANKKGNVVFLVITEKSNSQNQKALELAKNAQKKLTKSAVVELDRSNASNSSLVKKYRLSGANLPLILLIGTNGCAAGGTNIDNLTVEQLLNIVPTPKEEIVLKAFEDGKSVFVVISKKSDTKNQKQLDACQSACKTMGNKAVTVNLDYDDTKEKSFISTFDMDKNPKFPITYVMNEKAQITSTLNGIADSKSLVAAAKKKVSSSCCPPGSGKTCGPAKK